MRELRARVTVAGAAMTVVLAGLAFVLAGPRAGLGVAMAGGLTLVNFWWLVHNAGVVMGSGPASSRLVWVVLAGGRYLIVVAAFLLLLAAEIVHPLAFVAGLVIVPVAVIGLGLHAAGRARVC